MKRPSCAFAALVLLCCVLPCHAAPLKILILGNSITTHAPAEKIGWTGNHGMAASAPQNDFVHRLARRFAEETGERPRVIARNIAAWEKSFAMDDAVASLADGRALAPDLVIVALGENVPELKSGEDRRSFAAAYSTLLSTIKAGGTPALYCRGTFWPDETKDRIMRDACVAAGGTFVDISAIGRDPKNKAESERRFANAGVGAHPGDRGMRAIADAIWAAVKSQERGHRISPSAATAAKPAG